MTKDRTRTPWNDGNTVQFPAPPKMPRNPRRCTTGKIRTRCSGRNHRFNPMKMSRLNTRATKMSDLNKIDIVAPKPRKECNSISLSCSYCKLEVPHPSPQNSDWSSEDLDGNKAKAKEQSTCKPLIDFNDPKPQTSTEQTMVTLPSSLACYEFYIFIVIGSICRCNVVSTSSVVWSQVRQFFLLRKVFHTINHDEII